MYKLIIVTVLFLITLTGCSGGGGDSSTSAITTPISVVSGVVEDGPIENARVFIDENLNTQFDPGEPYDITDKYGKYQISYILDSERTYLLIAEGNNALNTLDERDNPNTVLTFKMFSEFKSVKYTSVSAISGKTYTQNIKPSIFKNYLSTLNDDSYGSLVPNNINIKNIIESDTALNETELFQQYILSRDINLGDIIDRVDALNKENDYKEIRADINIPLEGLVSSSDKNISELSELFYYQDKTVPNKIANIVISKDVNPPRKNLGHDVYVTPYTQILEIPDYMQLNERNSTVIAGADIKVTLDGIKVESNNAIALDIISTYDFPAITDRVDLYQYVNFKWILKASNKTIAEIKTTNIDLLPFVIVKNDTFVTKIYNIAEYDFANIAIVKGKYIGNVALVDGELMNQESVILSYGVVSDNGDLNVTIPAGFEVEEIVLIDREFIAITDRASLILEVSNDTIIEDQKTIITLKNVTDPVKKELILSGSLLDENVGIDAMIDTHILYNNMVISLNIIDDTVAQDLLLSNINNFLGGTNIFDSKTYTSLEFGNMTLDINQSSSTIELRELNVENGTIVDELSVVWKFSSDKIVRTLDHDYSSGEKMGSVYASTYIYEYKNQDDGIRVNFNESSFDKTNMIDYSFSKKTKQIGVATYKRNALDETTQILSSKFTQTHEQENSNSGKSYLNGLVETKDINTTVLDPFDNRLAFKGYFSLSSQEYENLSGEVTIYLEDANTTKALSNYNIISNAIILIEESTVPVADQFFIGNWNGTFTNDCSVLQGSIYIDFDTLSWQGFDGNETYYGTSISIDNNESILYDSAVKWGVLKIDDNNITATGTWSFNLCEGNISMSRQ